MEQVRNVIKKWKLNKRVLAEKLGVTVAVFNNKLSDKHQLEFSTQEKHALRNALIEMMNDLDEATNIDFNDALKTMLEA